MIIRCQNCGGAITCDPALADLMCRFCGSVFLTKNFSFPEAAALKRAVMGIRWNVRSIIVHPVQHT